MEDTTRTLSRCDCSIRLQQSRRHVSASNKAGSYNFSCDRFCTGYISSLGKIDSTCYGDVVTPELRDAIANTLLSPKPYFYASLGEPWTAEVNEWCRRQQINCTWAKKQVLEQASRDGRLLGFLRSIKSRRSLAIGELGNRSGRPRKDPLYGTASPMKTALGAAATYRDGHNRGCNPKHSCSPGTT